MLVTAIRRWPHEDGRLIADRQPVVSSGDGAAPLEAVDPTLDRVALTVVDRVELRRLAAARAALFAVARLVDLVRDGAADPSATQVSAVLAGGVRLISTHPIGADARSARPDAGHADLPQHGFELRRVAALPGRSHDRHGLLALLDGQVHLGGEPATRASQSMIMGLGEDTTRRFLLRVTCVRAPAAC